MGGDEEGIQIYGLGEWKAGCMQQWCESSGKYA